MVLGQRRPSIWSRRHYRADYHHWGRHHPPETARQELETELSEILGRVSDAFYALDNQFRFTHVNERAEELLQHSKEQLLDENLWELFPEATDAVAGGEQFLVTYRIETASGDVRWVRERGRGIFDDEGELTVLEGVIIDVTERKRLETELEETEYRYRTLAENFPNGAVGVYDHDFRFTLAAGAVLGDRLPSAETIEGNRLEELFPEEAVADLEPLYRAAVEDGESGSTTIEFAGRNWMVWAAPLRDSEGDIFAGLSFAQDITEQVERERKLKESNDRLERFASMLTHELRNPVTIGQIYSQQLSAEGDAEAVEYVTEAFERIEDMVDVLLVLARGREAVGESTSIDLATIIRGVWDQMETPDATLRVEIDAAIQADETYLRHLFENLFENAIEHGGADVTVTVGDLPNGFYVADDGTGIPADDREAIFEAGYTTAADHGGTGLGLAFVRELAEVYGWEHTVTDSEAGGARTLFAVPLALETC